MRLCENTILPKRTDRQASIQLAAGSKVPFLLILISIVLLLFLPIESIGILYLPTYLTSPTHLGGYRYAIHIHYLTRYRPCAYKDEGKNIPANSVRARSGPMKLSRVRVQEAYLVRTGLIEEAMHLSIS